MTKCDSEFLLSFIDEYVTRDHIDVVNHNGETTLYLAALAGKLDVVKKLLTLGIFFSRYYRTPFHRIYDL